MTRPTYEHLAGLAGAHLDADTAIRWPDLENPVLERWGLDELPDPFVEVLDDLIEQELGADGYGQQVGGWAQTVQGRSSTTRRGEATYDEAAGASWGDGVLYWLARTDGTTPPGPDVGFTWQCA